LVFGHTDGVNWLEGIVAWDEEEEYWAGMCGGVSLGSAIVVHKIYYAKWSS